MSPQRPTILTLKALRKDFGAFTAVDGIDLTIAEGEFFTIVGPSGSGKTTLIRAIAGPYDLGTVIVRAGITINPITAAITVDSDALPILP